MAANPTPAYKRMMDRILRRLKLERGAPPTDLGQWQEFLDGVELHFKHTEEDRYILERSIEISSEEMRVEIQRNKEMSLQLTRAGQMVSLGTLASGVAHELNNPLAAIKGYVELIGAEGNLTSKQGEMVIRTQKLIDRMSATIRHLLKLSRQQNGAVLSAVDLSGPIRESLDLMATQLRMEQIAVETTVSPSAPRAQANALNLEGVIQNLCSNSRDAFLASKHPGPRKIQIRIASDSEGNPLVEFEDNAGGMSPEVLARIFDPFFTTKEVGKGTGLGLALAKQVIEEMKGSLSASSVLGSGTVFRIQFLRAAENTGHEPVRSIGEAQKTVHWDRIPNRRLKALLVDDEPDICDGLGETLNGYFELTATSSPSEAMGWLKKGGFEIVISDLKMPKISGIDLCREARKQNPSCYVVLMSGHLSESAPEGVAQLEPCLFLPKPLPARNALIQAIFEHIGQVRNRAA